MLVVLSLIGALVVQAGVVSGPLAGAVAPAGAGRFVALSPTRLVDSRLGLGVAAGRTSPGATLTFQVTGAAGVPSGATAVALNVTIAGSVAGGYTTVYPTGASAPWASTVNVSNAGETRANFAMVALPGDGRLSALMAAGGDLVIDVSGYWVAASTATAGRFKPIDPVRLADTRFGGVASPDYGFQTIDVVVAGQAGIPADAAAVAVTVTAQAPRAWTYVTVWPAGATRPEASTLNVMSRTATVPNLALVPLGAGGAISLYSPETVNFVVDVVGWFTGTSAASGDDGLFVPLTPSRIADSRAGQSIGRLAPMMFDEVQVTGQAGVPASGVGSVAVNLTATAAESEGYALAYAARTTRPYASNLNFTPGQDVAAFALSRVGANGAVGLLAGRSTEMIVDIAGWFTGTPAPTTDPQPPRHCSKLMAYLHNTDPVTGANEVRVRDLSGATPELTVVPGLNAQAVRVAPNCDFLLIAVKAAGQLGRYDIALVRNFTEPNPPWGPIMGNYAWHGLAISPDSRYVYSYAGSTDTYDIIGAYDVQTNGQTAFAAGAGPARSLGFVADADTDKVLVSNDTNGAGSWKLQWCNVTYGPAVSNWCAPFPWTNGIAQDAAISPVTTYPNAAIYTPGDSVRLVGPALDKPIEPHGFTPRFTWNGELVVANATNHPGVWKYPAVTAQNAGTQLNPTLLLDMVYDHSAAFPRPWNTTRTRLYGTQRTGPVTYPTSDSPAPTQFDQQTQANTLTDPPIGPYHPYIGESGVDGCKFGGGQAPCTDGFSDPRSGRADIGRTP